MGNDFRILKTTKTKLGNEIQLIGNNSSNTNKISLVIGVFHGDEPQGKFLIEEYLKKCGMLPTSKSPIARRGLLFIPCLNPDGMQLGQRTNANGVDLNRNFPTKNWGKNQGDNATCNDSNSAYYGGTSGGSEIETQFLIDTINEFKPDKILTLHAPYPTPGSFGTYAGVEKQIQTITLELDEEIPVEQLVQPAFEIFDKLL